MIDIKQKSYCCGCTACLSVCPKKAIKMVADDEGFKYPVVDKALCINCGLCEKVCPINKANIKNDSNTNKIYALQNNDKEIRNVSTSGGAFYALASKMIDEGGVIYGATFSFNMEVIHDRTIKKTDLIKMCGAKYVQSNLKNTFLNIKDDLNHNRKVLFVGTPCQVEGLISFIGYNDNLYTIDLLCYGVPSPGIYMDWKNYLEEKYNSKIININFRDKKYGYCGTNTCIYFKNNKKLEDCYDAKSYLLTMFSKLGLRPSCYSCKFASRNKKSDYTIGDLWEIGEFNKKMDDNLGTTAVEVHTIKGEKLLLGIDNIKIYDLTDKYNLRKSTIKEIDNNIREKFFSDYKLLGYNNAMGKYYPVTVKSRFINISKSLIGKTGFGKSIFKNYKIKKLKEKK